MFVWAFRDKGSEWRTVHNFLERGVVPFTPLVEAVRERFLPAKDKPTPHPVAVLTKLSSRLEPLTDSGRVWIDLGHILGLFSPNDVAEMHDIVRRNRGLVRNLVTPVVRSSSPDPVIAATIEWAREEHSGICIRVDGLTHLASKSDTVQDLMRLSGLAPTEIDLIVDAQDLPRAVGHEELRDAFPLSQAARAFVVLAGTFPKGITEMSPNEYEHTRERGEWLVWQDEIDRPGNWRRPNYGDFATQPAIYSPSPPFPGSPSVRYTVGDRFVVLRGRGGSNGKPTDYSQYVGHARYLRQQSYYRDLLSTSGDDYVERIATGGNGTGNLSTWRVASLERHIGVVAYQVAQFARIFAQTRRVGTK